MGTAFGPLLRIGGTRPERMADGCTGPFHEGLAEELRALEPPMDPTRVPAAFGDRRHARILLELRGGGLACAWFANSHEEPRGEDRTGAWSRLKADEVGMGWGEWRHRVVEVVDGLQGDAELGHESPDEAHMGRDDPRICRERAGAVARLDAWGDDTGLHMMLAKEALKGGTACLLDRFEGWPLGEEVAEDGRVVVGEP
jgi:hypothetical protein